MGHAMHHPVAHGFDRRETWLRIEPINQPIRCRLVIRGCDAEAFLLIPIGVLESQVRAGQADPVDLPVKLSFQCFA